MPRIQSLRAEGVLVIGSGFMTHGGRYLTQDNFQRGVIPSWSADALAQDDVDTLAS